MQKNEDGLTLIETLIIIAIMAFLALSIFQMIGVSLGQFSINRDQTSAFQNANMAMAMMIRD